MTANRLHAEPQSSHGLTDGEARTRQLGMGHLPALDGLRGIAILAVMLSHLFQVNYQGGSWPVRFLGTTFYYGWMGVDLFFVLSGFLITGILLQSLGDPDYFRKFYMRRILRIFPLYYGMLLVVFLFTVPLRVRWHGLGWPLVLYLQNLLQFNPLTSHMGPYIEMNHLWSLAIEEQFYLLWPLLVFFARTPKNVLRIACIGSALALCFRIYLIVVLHNGYTTHFNVFARSDALLLGAVAAVLHRNSPARWSVALQWSPWMAIVFGGFVATTLMLRGPGLFAAPVWVYAIRYSVVAVASTALLIWSLRVGPFSRALRWRGLRFLGKYSYGLYVLHMLFLPFLSRTLRIAYGRMLPGKLAAVLATAVTIFCLACVAAFLSFHLYEKRFLRLKRYFDYAVPRNEKHLPTAVVSPQTSR